MAKRRVIRFVAEALLLAAISYAIGLFLSSGGGSPPKVQPLSARASLKYAGSDSVSFFQADGTACDWRRLDPYGPRNGTLVLRIPLACSSLKVPIVIPSPDGDHVLIALRDPGGNAAHFVEVLSPSGLARMFSVSQQFDELGFAPDGAVLELRGDPPKPSLFAPLSAWLHLPVPDCVPGSNVLRRLNPDGSWEIVSAWAVGCRSGMGPRDGTFLGVLSVPTRMQGTPRATSTETAVLNHGLRCAVTDWAVVAAEGTHVMGWSQTLGEFVIADSRAGTHKELADPLAHGLPAFVIPNGPWVLLGYPHNHAGDDALLLVNLNRGETTAVAEIGTSGEPFFGVGPWPFVLGDAPRGTEKVWGRYTRRVFGQSVEPDAPATK